MLASVLIEYSAKSLDRVFDYLIPEKLAGKLKIGHKVIVPFAKVKVEGFVINIHNNYDKNITYKSIEQISNE